MKKQLKTRDACVTNQQSFVGFFYILITSYLASCLGQETGKEPFWSLSQAATCQLRARWRLHITNIAQQ